MRADQGVPLATCERTIDAPVDIVWDLVTTAAGLTTWMAVEASVDPTPGGAITWRHDNGEVVEGVVVEVVPMRRFVFTYGWATGFLPVPPGSTTVTIEFESIANATRVSLRHTGLSAELADRHAAGWAHFVGRWADRAEELALP